MRLVLAQTRQTSLRAILDFLTIADENAAIAHRLTVAMKAQGVIRLTSIPSVHTQSKLEGTVPAGKIIACI